MTQEQAQNEMENSYPDGIRFIYGKYDSDEADGIYTDSEGGKWAMTVDYGAAHITGRKSMEKCYKCGCDLPNQGQKANDHRVGDLRGDDVVFRQAEDGSWWYKSNHVLMGASQGPYPTLDEAKQQFDRMTRSRIR